MPMNIPNSKVCLKGEWSICSTKQPLYCSLFFRPYNTFRIILIVQIVKFPLRLTSGHWVLLLLN